MCGFYRTYASLAVLLGINLAVRILNIDVSSNLLFGNHLVEAAAALTVVSLLVDLNIINHEIQRNYFKIGLIAFFGGIIMVVASFSSLFVWKEFISITITWFKVAPFIIFLIGVPSLYFADKLSQKQIFLGMNNTGKRGLINIVMVCVAYSILAMYLLIKYNLLKP